MKSSKNPNRNSKKNKKNKKKAKKQKSQSNNTDDQHKKHTISQDRLHHHHHVDFNMREREGREFVDDTNDVKLEVGIGKTLVSWCYIDANGQAHGFCRG